ncbi:MAG: cupredoxin domain-containing protein [bacterium]|nr:cupredoxin domain-containing protein [bacterium]
MKKTIATLLLVLSPLLLAGCEDEQTTQESDQAAPSGTVKTEEIEPGAEATTETATKVEVREITMTAKKFEFTPDTITAKKGEKLRLEITATDVAHGFAISEFNINQPIDPGKTTIVEFIPDKAGEFDFSCSVFCGGGHGGMRGKLVVEE